jgi:lysyl-tRNA synthetase class 1
MHDSLPQTEILSQAKSWPFQEARVLISRLKSLKTKKDIITFQTGYGPSGLPHLGTFAEVLRSSMVKRAFETLSGLPSQLITFSDDMDALRKVPEGVPNHSMLEKHLGKPLTSIPDPYGTHQSFGHHNNAKLIEFLDQFGFEYTFASSSEYYKSGFFNDTLVNILHLYHEITNIILPTLGKERQQTYSPFLPICRNSGNVLQLPVHSIDLDAQTLVFKKEDGTFYETPVTDGTCKLQWKADWAMRWLALGVDYEMAGKDLIESVHLSSRILKKIGGTPPAGFSYELFLDENGEKISKSRGNGMSMDEWLKYGGTDSLAYFLFQKPKTAKRLSFDSIPRAIDDYNRMLASFPSQSSLQQIDNPIWHIHHKNIPHNPSPVSFNLLLNLAAATGETDSSILWNFVKRYAPETSPKTHPYLNSLIQNAVSYAQDNIIPLKEFRKPSPHEHNALKDLLEQLNHVPHNSEDIQTLVFSIGKTHNFDPITSWFQACYSILLGQKQGPKLGTFIALYGIKETQNLISNALEHV